MFHRFNNSARRVLFRARDNAISEGGAYVEPHHILVALGDLHPEGFARLFIVQADAGAVRQDFRLNPNPSGIAHDPGKVRFCNRTKQVLVSATEEAEFCWQKWEKPRRRPGAILPEDLAYWEARLHQPILVSKRPSWFGRWILRTKRPPWFGRWIPRRKWEVDERHLLLGLLKASECPITALLAERDVNLDSARQRLCANT